MPRYYLDGMSKYQLVWAAGPRVAERVIDCAYGVEGVFLLFFSTQLLLASSYPKCSCTVSNIPQNAGCQDLPQIGNEVQALLPRFDDVQLLIEVGILPLDVTAWLNQHERDLMWEAALTDGKHESVFGKLCGIILLFVDKTLL